MRSAYSAAQIRDAERPLLEAGVPLMARAAAGLAEVLRTLLAGSERGRRIVVLVGSGDNGGDALYAAAALAADGAEVVLVPTGSRMHEGGLAAARAAGATEATPDAAPGGWGTHDASVPSQVAHISRDPLDPAFRDRAFREGCCDDCSARRY